MRSVHPGWECSSPVPGGLVRSIKPSSCGRDSKVIRSSIGSTDEEAGAWGRESTGKDVGLVFSWAVESQSKVFFLPHLDADVLSSGSPGQLSFPKSHSCVSPPRFSKPIPESDVPSTQ